MYIYFELKHNNTNFLIKNVINTSQSISQSIFMMEV